MQTYWLIKPGETDNFEDEDKAAEAAAMAAIAKSDGPSYVATAKNSTNLEEIESSLPPKILRLVSWNVEILKKQLQAVIAKRNAVNSKRNNDAQVARREADFNKQKHLLGEVTEVISLPKFDPKAHKNREPPNQVVIPDVVVRELRLFVSAIAASHRDVPFHNFEHASHVTMSVTKLLSRIVAPSEILDQEDEEGGDIHAALHDHTFGITSDPLTQFAVILSALIHDVDHYGGEYCVLRTAVEVPCPCSSFASCQSNH
jgi:3'5'-cyclic nucleotide phosphodiesterase